MSNRVDTPEHASGWSVASVEDYTFLGNGYLLDAGHRPVVYRSNLNPEPVRKGRREHLFKYRMISRALPLMRMERATWVCRPNASNYFHWLIETVPKLYLLDQIGWREPIVMGNQLLQKEWVRETLQLFPNLEFIFVPRHKMIRVKTLFLVNEGDLSTWEEKKKLHLRNAVILKEVKEFLRRALKLAPQGTPSRRIHISRQQDATRKIANIEAVRPVLDKFGFEEVTMLGFSLAEQFVLMSQTEMVFAPHGAGMANTIFMPEGGRVLEVQHLGTFPQDGLFPGLSQTMGLSHHVLKGEREAGRNDDFVVNPRTLEEKLAEIVGVRR